MRRLKTLAAAAASALALMSTASPASAQVEQYIGSLFQFGMNWCPDGWFPADGRLLSISQYTALYSLYGVAYGGDGRVTFALPDLRTRMPVSTSNDLPTGAMDGTANVTVLQMNLPAHRHVFNGDDTGPATNSPSGSMLGMFPSGQTIYAAPAAPLSQIMNYAMMHATGGSNPLPVQSPVLAVSWCVAYEGVYPSHP